MFERRNRDDSGGHVTFQSSIPSHRWSLPGVVVDAPEGPVQTTAFEIEDDVIRALYVVRNPDK